MPGGLVLRFGPTRDFGNTVSLSFSRATFWPSGLTARGLFCSRGRRQRLRGKWSFSPDKSTRDRRGTPVDRRKGQSAPQGEWPFEKLRERETAEQCEAEETGVGQVGPGRVKGLK